MQSTFSIYHRGDHLIFYSHQVQRVIYFIHIPRIPFTFQTQYFFLPQYTLPNHTQMRRKCKYLP